MCSHAAIYILLSAATGWHSWTPADVCWCLLTYADACWRIQLSVANGWHRAMRCDYQNICWRMLTYADVCWRMLLYSYQWRTVGVFQCGVAIRLSRRTRPQTGVRYIRSYIFVFILLYTKYYLFVCPQTTTCVRILLILLYMCPDTTVYVSLSLMPYALCLMPYASTCLML